MRKGLNESVRVVTNRCAASLVLDGRGRVFRKSVQGVSHFAGGRLLRQTGREDEMDESV